MLNLKMLLQNKTEGTPVLWEQPILTENGVLGGSSFAVWTDVAIYPNSGLDVWRAFDGTNYLFHSDQNCTNGNIIMYNPNPLMIKEFQIVNQQSYNTRSTRNGYIYASNDNSTYTLLATINNTSPYSPWTIDLSGNNNYYKYYKYNTVDTWDSFWTIEEIHITAYVRS